MAATPEPTPQLRAAYALSQARKHRHHRDCRCRLFDRNGIDRGFCNAADAMWQNRMNLALDEIPRTPKPGIKAADTRQPNHTIGYPSTR
jgi:hypothetical protein